MSDSKRDDVQKTAARPLSDTGGESLLWRLFLAVALGALVYGFAAGDVTEAEAEILLTANGVAPARQCGQDTQWTTASGYAHLLAAIHQATGQEIGPSALRLVSLLSVLLTVLALYRWLRRQSGATAAHAAAVTFLCCPGTMLAAMSARPDALLVLLVIVATYRLSWGLVPSLAVKERPGRRLLDISAGGVLFLVASLLIWGGEPSGGKQALDDRLLGPIYSSLLALPGSAGLLICCRPVLLAPLSRGDKQLLFGSVCLLSAGLITTTLQPIHWIGSAVILAVAGAVPLGIVWQRWRTEAGTADTQRLRGAMLTSSILAIPALAVVGSVARIGLNYHFMERYQAIFVVGLASLVVGGTIAYRQRRWLYPIPILAVLVVCKIIYINAWLPERDHWQSPKPHARSVSRLLPQGARLYTDLPLGAAYRYYLGTAVGTLEEVDRPSANKAMPRFALLAEPQFWDLAESDSGSWQSLRVFEGPWSCRSVLASYRPTGSRADLQKKAALPLSLRGAEEERQAPYVLSGCPKDSRPQ